MAAAGGSFAAESRPALTPTPKLEGDNYDWTARHRRILSEQAAMDPEIVLIGDSITHRWAGLGSIGGADAEARFKAAFAGRRVLNLGFGWDRTGNVLWRLENGELKGLKPKLIVVHIGGNNFSKTARYAGDTPEDVAHGVIAVVRKTHAMVPGAKIVLMGIFPFGRTPKDLHRTKIPAANALLAKAAKQMPYVTYIDLTDQLLDASGTYPAALAPDAIHPSSAGYDIWAAALKPEISKTFSPRP